ncbi:hypothetical protein L915_14610 [Phytophthora nicotianae]|uniref:Uncharacterized protein n=1 Tax=Phytophthora nicotianae TaxID=4792 RepID=W2GBH1_PHYNI|nr:hypothetical protein L915_14610 [Phytophthora nicotianae]
MAISAKIPHKTLKSVISSKLSSVVENKTSY